MAAFDDWSAEMEKDYAWGMMLMHCNMAENANREPAWKRRRRS